MSPLFYTCDGTIAYITLNRPAMRNVLDRSTLLALLVAIERAVMDGARGLVLTSNGEIAFSAGADLKERAGFNAEEMVSFCQLGQQVTNALEEAPLIAVAAINGSALGGGFEIALACDLLYAVPEAMLGLPEVKLGLIPGFGGVQRLTRILGPIRAKALLFRGASLTAQEAHTLGIVNNVIERSQLLNHCHTAIKEIVQHPQEALTYIKKAINTHGTAPPSTLYTIEAQQCALALIKPTTTEALQQFLNHKNLS